MTNGEVPKIANYFTAILVHIMAHWKIIALYVLHREHQSNTYSLAVIATTALVEHMFIHFVTPPNLQTILFTIHHLTIVAYCCNILLRGRKPLWILMIIAWASLHIATWKKPKQNALLITTDFVLATSGIYTTIFKC